MSAKTLYMHIGMPKTGTSAIQAFLKINRGTLDSHGFTYPKRCNHLNELWSRSTERQKQSKILWADIKDKLDKYENDFIISDEGIHMSLLHEPEILVELINFIAPHQVKIILYLRRQDLHLESYYRQLVRGMKTNIPFSATAIDQIIFPGYYDYMSFLERLAPLLDTQNIIIRVYDRNLFQAGNIAWDFCEAVGINTELPLQMPPRQENPSIDARPMGLVLTANQMILEDGGRLREFKELIDCVENFAFSERENKLLSSQERKMLLDTFREGNCAIAQKYLQKEELFDERNVFTLGEPKPLSEHDLYMLLFNLNAAWVKGMGAVPFALYNKLKVNHLKLKAPSMLGSRRSILTIERLLLSLFNTLCARVVPRKWLNTSLDKTLMRYIRKNTNLIQQNGTKLLD